MEAIVLAGGKGERLSPFTNNCPKGMLRIEGRPILEYQLEWLKRNGITKIIFACGYLNQVIKDYFEDGRKFSLEVCYSVEEEPLGRGGAVKKAWEMVSTNEPVIVTNGDIYTDMDLEKAVKAHKERISELRSWQAEENKNKSIIATICLFPYKSPYGVIRINEDGLVQSFEEKRNLPYWVNGGIYIFEHEVRGYLPDKGDHEVTMFPQLAQKKILFGYKSYDYWRGIDTIKDLNEFAHDKKNLSSVR